MDNLDNLEGGGFFHFSSSYSVIYKVDWILNKILNTKLNDYEIMKIYEFVNEKLK